MSYGATMDKRPILVSCFVVPDIGQEDYMMKLSTTTKAKAVEYIDALRVHIKKETGLDLKSKPLRFVRQAYENKLHQQEKDIGVYLALCDAINAWRAAHGVSNVDCEKHLNGYLDCSGCTDKNGDDART